MCMVFDFIQLSALSMRLENLNLLDNVSGSVDKAHIHSLSRSMRNIKSLEVPSFDGLEETSFDSVKSLDEVEDLHQIHTPAHVTMSEQDQEVLSDGKMAAWSLCDANRLVQSVCI